MNLHFRPRAHALHQYFVPLRRGVAGVTFLLGAAGVFAAQSNSGGGGGGGTSPPPSPPSSSPPQSQPYIPLHIPLPPTDQRTQTDFYREQQLREWQKAHPLRMYFPPNPPPLGVEVILPPDSYTRGAPPADAIADVAEPYFPALSTRTIDTRVGLRPPTVRRLANYRATRDTLLEALRLTLAEHATSDPATRQSALESLAAAQADGLARLENQADKLRAELADGVSWSALREWRLGNGAAGEPREKHHFLEYQVLRAATFYEPGLEPAQRRLVREAAQILEAKVFAERDAVDTMPLFPFFSPDLLRVRLPAGAPPAAVSAMAEFQTRKTALRDEAREAVYTHDAASESTRRRAWQRLSKAQAPGLAALDELAEDIRRELARMPDRSWRAEAPVALPEGVHADIGHYRSARRAMQRQLEEYITKAAAAADPDATVAGAPPVMSEAQMEQRRRRIQAATDAFLREHAAELAALTQSARAIALRLAPVLPASEQLHPADVAEEWLMEFIRRREQAATTHEFDVAAFEPGLSPAQRRLLFRAACARLELPLVGPEFQPVEAPKTILR